jgi:precorrin-6Y C5,15-methyltransferase (decarboxylating)
MTKSEVRDLIVSKLGLKDESVVYDVVADTGSVLVEMARVAVGGTVYAI